MEKINKVWANGLTTDETIEEFNRLYRKITKAHLRRYRCKHRVNIIYLVKDGIISEGELDLQ